MEFTAKTVEEAVEQGLKELGLCKACANVEILEKPVKGLFGRVKGKAVVRITKRECEEEKQEITFSEESINAKNFVDEILKFMEIEAQSELSIKDGKTIITLSSEESSVLIGRRGEILDAIQTLAGAVLNIGKKEYKKLVVDCDSFRNKREETLISLAKKLEAKATEMRREVLLEPMSPFERRIIHTTLSDSTTVTTRSDGKEPNRYVVIVPNEKDEFKGPYSAARNSDGRRIKSSSKSGARDKRYNKNGKGRSTGQVKKSGFTEQRKKTSISFGTYLGNSFKDKE